MKNVIQKTKTTYLFNYSIYVTNAPPKKPDDTVGFFAVKREITVIVFNI